AHFSAPPRLATRPISGTAILSRTAWPPVLCWPPATSSLRDPLKIDVCGGGPSACHAQKSVIQNAGPRWRDKNRFHATEQITYGAKSGSYGATVRARALGGGRLNRAD